MTKIVSSLSQATGRGIFGTFQRERAAARAVGTGRAVMVCSPPWGPVNEQVAYESPGVFRSKFAPAGFDRTGESYNTAVQFPWPDLHVIRVVGASAAAATINLQKTGPSDCVKVDAKYVGAAGNGIVCVVADAGNGVTTSFKLTITKTNSATGKSTSEVYDNVDSTQAAGSYWTNLTRNSVLVGPLVKSATGRPANGTYTLAAGSDGSALAGSDFLGTPGSADAGLALCEKDQSIAFVFANDVPSGIAATVRAGLAAHQALMNDLRVAILHGVADDDESTAKTTAAVNQGEMIAYAYPFAEVLDEDAASDDAEKIEIPLSGPLACLASIMAPHVSPAFKRNDFTRMLSAIKGLTAGSGSAQSLASLEANGVIPFERNKNGTFSPYSSTMTDQSTPMWAARMKRYLVISIGDALDEYRNAPNEDSIQDDERTIAAGFLKQLVDNRKKDAVFLPCLNDAGLQPEEATNTALDIANGDYTIGFDATLISEQKRLIIKGNIGTQVVVEASLAG